MRILALDLGSTTGIAYQRDDDRPEFAIQHFDLKRGESPGMRYIRFNAWLGSVVYIEMIPNIIVYEEAHFRGGFATEVACGFTTRIQEFCAKHDINHTAVHTGTLKKFATGSGRASKEDMIEAFRKRYNQEPEDDNVADAGCLLWYAVEEIVGWLCPRARGKS